MSKLRNSHPTISCTCNFFFNDTATTEIYTLSLHDALPISSRCTRRRGRASPWAGRRRDRSTGSNRSEEHTSELQSQSNLVCRPLLEKKTIAYYFVYQALSHRLLVFYITSLPMFY